MFQMSNDGDSFHHAQVVEVAMPMSVIRLEASRAPIPEVPAFFFDEQAQIEDETDDQVDLARDGQDDRPDHHQPGESRKHEIAANVVEGLAPKEAKKLKQLAFDEDTE